MQNLINFLQDKSTLSRALAVFTVASMVAFSFGPFTALTVEAGAKVYSIQITGASFSGTTLTISGSAFTDEYVGTLDRQFVKFSWDSSTTTDDEVFQADNLTVFPNFTASSTGKRFTINPWSRSHNYGAEGPFTVTVKIYHGQVGGAEGSVSESSTFTIETENTLPRCTDGIDNDHDDLIDADDPDCLQFQPGHLVVKKIIINDNGGSAATSTFSFQVNGGNAVLFEADAENVLSVSAGTYTVTEVATSTYTPSYQGCTGVTVPPNATTTCTITNDDKAAHLIVIKHVVNDNGGTATANQWTMTIGGVTASGGNSFAGAESSGVDKTLTTVGTYTVTENAGPSGYSQISASTDCSGSIALGQTKTCTITNNDIPATITVIKQLVQDNGGTEQVGHFTLLVGIQSVLSNIQNLFSPGNYTISETNDTGYTHTFSGNCDSAGAVALALGENKTCTITNNDIVPSLTLQKVVVDNNDNNGTTPASVWTLNATGLTPISGPGPSVSSDSTFNAGTYNLSESGGPAGYTASSWVCTGGSQVDGDTVTVGLGQNVTCTITNDDIPLPICSNSIDDDGDGLIDTADPGCHTDKDANNPDSYNPNGTSEGNETTLTLCTDGIDNDNDGDIDLADSDCAAFIPKLIVEKTLINNDYGTAATSSFSFMVNGGEPISFETDGSNEITVNPGSYSVIESPASGYSTTYSSECEGTIVAGDTKTCTITNDDQPTTLIVQKVLINDSGKNNATSSFSFMINGDEISSIFENDGENIFLVAPGTYSVLENEAPGYNTSYSLGESNSCSEIPLALGGTATCTITNNDIPACSDGIDNDGDGAIDTNDPGCHSDQNPENQDSYNPDTQSEGNETTFSLCTDGIDNDGDEAVDLADSDCAAFKPKLTVTKTVINDNGGTKTVENFPLTVNNSGVSSGVEATFDAVGVYAVAESNADGYTATFGGSCDSTGQVTLNAGDIKSCTITNDDNAPTPTPSGGGGGGGNGPPGLIVFGNGSVLGASTGPINLGQVLAEATCSTEYLRDYIKLGKKNDKDQVIKLQTFLNKWIKSNLPLTGFYGSKTFAAVKTFQVTYGEQILGPWVAAGLHPNTKTPTGYVYKTTKRWINLLECPELHIPVPALP